MKKKHAEAQASAAPSPDSNFTRRERAFEKLTESGRSLRVLLVFRRLRLVPRLQNLGLPLGLDSGLELRLPLGRLFLPPVESVLDGDFERAERQAFRQRARVA